MSAVRELIAALVAGGMDPADAAVLVARAGVEMVEPPPKSAAAERQQRYRDRKMASGERNESVTNRNESVTRYGRNESVTKRNEPSQKRNALRSDENALSLLSKKERKKERERGARARSLPSDFPDEFSLTAADIDEAHNAGMTDAVIDAELKIFMARKRSDGRKSADWSAEWSIWCQRWKTLKPLKPRKPDDADPPAALDYDRQIARFKRGMPWTNRIWGPEPGQLGCKAPPELLAKHGYSATH